MIVNKKQYSEKMCYALGSLGLRVVFAVAFSALGWSAFALRAVFFAGFSSAAVSAFALRVVFLGALSSAASALVLRVVFFTGFSADFAFAAQGFFAAVFLEASALVTAVLLVRFAGTSNYRVLMGGRVMVMDCSKPCMGFLWVRTGLLCTVPEPPKAASSLFRISL